MLRIHRFALLVTLVACLFAPQVIADDKPLDAPAALEALKKLAGNWSSKDGGEHGPGGIEFRVTAAGSAVTATFYPGSDMEMLSVFHLDGEDELVHTHYCALGNQPTMRLVKGDKPNEMRFEFTGGTSLDPKKDMHVHNMTLRVLGPNRIESEVEAWNEGKPAASHKFTLDRQLADATAAKAASVEPKSEFFTASDGIKIHYLMLGDHGSPVVLVHGYTGSADGNWFLNGIAQALAENHRVVAIDCRGHGESDKPHESGKYGGQMAKDVFELMDHLKIQKAHIHGYSMGGFITSQLMALDPARFITASFGGSGVPETDPDQLAKVPADKTESDPQEAEARSKLSNAPHRDEQALTAVRGSWGNVDRSKLDLTKIQFPVLAINGEFDKPNQKTHRMQRELANFKSVILPGKSHLTAIMADYMPQEYITELTAFINKNDAQ